MQNFKMQKHYFFFQPTYNNFSTSFKRSFWLWLFTARDGSLYLSCCLWWGEVFCPFFFFNVRPNDQNHIWLLSSLKCKRQRSCSSVTLTYKDAAMPLFLLISYFCISCDCPPGNYPPSQISGKGWRQGTTSNWQGASICSRKRGNLLIVIFFMDCV